MKGKTVSASEILGGWVGKVPINSHLLYLSIVWDAWWITLIAGAVQTNPCDNVSLASLASEAAREYTGLISNGS